ncbi:hypothetical protein ACQ86B_28455 (plasmid) [Mycolicibacterium aichiense]|uniref:hypothetical protein n=1 Tax=Mycolicibacterium aichiense TaxID=1799 RepID=UPI003D679D90
MIAAHPRRAGLEVVTHPTPAPITADSTADADDARATTVIDQYSAEHQLIGSLMWLSADSARPLLKLVPDNAIWRPLTRWAYELIRHVVGDGGTPTPPAVLAAARVYPASDALDPAHTLTATRHRQLALYLFDAYAQAISPAAAATTYAREVLDQAYRRTFETCGVRMQHLASSGLQCESLNSELTLMREELADLWVRSQAAAPQPSAPRDRAATDSVP